MEVGEMEMEEERRLEAEPVGNDGSDNFYSAHFEPQVVGGGGGGTSVPIMAMMVAPSPPPKPTSTSSKFSDICQQGRSAAPKSDYSESLASNDYSFYSYQGSVLLALRTPVIDPTGKRPGRESVNKPAKRSF